mgnify:CR=1 FL=1
MNEEMKNQTEQLPLLKVHMMGSFFLELSLIHISEPTRH